MKKNTYNFQKKFPANLYTTVRLDNRYNSGTIRNPKRETTKATNRNNNSTIAETDILIDIPVNHSVTVNYVSPLQGSGDILF